MKPDPLEPPSGLTEATRRFLDHCRLSIDASGAPPERLLQEVAVAFSRIPYENLTKIIKYSKEGSPERARRWPLEVVGDHIALGAGGTCFSLTAALLHILRALGWAAEPILADRRYGANTHCALLVTIEGAPHILDPGFLILRPVPVRMSGETRIETAFNDVILEPVKGSDKIDLFTVEGKRRKYRLTFKASPADRGEFLEAWDSSFEWDMMLYPLLSRVCGKGQLYLQAGKFQVRRHDAVDRREIGCEELPDLIAREFGVDPRIAAAALEILKGE